MTGASGVPLVVEPAVPVELAAPGAAGLPAEVAGQVTGMVATRLTSLGERLGLALTPAVTLTEAEPGGRITVTVNGRNCWYPAGLPASLLGYLGVSASPQDLLAELLPEARQPGDPASVLAGNYLGLLAGQALEARPSLLVPSGGVRAPEGAQVDPLVFESVVRDLLDLGLFAGDPDQVADAVRAAPFGADAAEQLAAARALPYWLVLVAPDYLRELTLSEVASGAGFIAELRRAAAFDLGMPLPDFRLQADPTLLEGSFRFRVNLTMTVPVRGVPADRVFAFGPGAEQLIDATAVGEQMSGQPGVLLPASRRPELEPLGLTALTPSDFLAVCLYWVLRGQLARLVDTNRVSAALDHLAQWRPAQAAMARKVLPAATLTRSLRELAEEGVPVRNLALITDLMLEHQACEVTTDRLAWIRAGLAETIAGACASGFRQLAPLELREETQALAVTWLESGEQDTARAAFLKSFAAALEHGQGLLVLAAPGARRAVYLAARDEYPGIAVISRAEVPPGYTVTVPTAPAER